MLLVLSVLGLGSVFRSLFNRFFFLFSCSLVLNCVHLNLVFVLCSCVLSLALSEPDVVLLNTRIIYYFNHCSVWIQYSLVIDSGLMYIFLGLSLVSVESFLMLFLI